MRPKTWGPTAYYGISKCLGKEQQQLSYKGPLDAVEKHRLNYHGDGGGTIKIGDDKYRKPSFTKQVAD